LTSKALQIMTLDSIILKLLYETTCTAHKWIKAYEFLLRGQHNGEPERSIYYQTGQ